MKPIDVMKLFQAHLGPDADFYDLQTLVMEFIASLDGHRGVDIEACLKGWLQEHV